ncbi:BMC domain-containing protein [Alkaliphilus crotonatoxidans]
MTLLSMGLLETVGLTAGIEAADAMVKAANVRLIGFENTKGNGLITVKVEGDVGAVQSAVEAGALAAAKVGKVYSKLVIPRPSPEIEILKKSDWASSSHEMKPKALAESPQAAKENHNVSPNHQEDQETLSIDSNQEQEPTCNLCHDSRCGRKKGEPRSWCIHAEGE